eukprot:9851260-Karenia_brevis.AAC.1
MLRKQGEILAAAIHKSLDTTVQEAIKIGVNAAASPWQSPAASPRDAHGPIQSFPPAPVPPGGGSSNDKGYSQLQLMLMSAELGHK